MKKNNVIRQFSTRLGAWMHRWIEQKAEHLDNCAWYPGPCQTEFPY